MLKKLTIKNVALIVSVEIDFKNGLNVLSGETGAGKSVIIDSLNFVLGAKADKSMIRSGQDECFVKAEFEVDSNLVNDVLNDLDIECDDLLIISRKFNVDGKTNIKINGSTVTASMLKKLTSKLVDVHGQSEHFYLLKSSNQLELIDKFGGEEIDSIKSSVKTLFYERKETLRQLDSMGGDESQRLTRLDVLNYQINEIITADIKENEEEDLIILRDKLKNQEKIMLSLNGAKGSINDEGGALDLISNANRCISSISSFGEEYSSIFDRLSSVYSELDDVLSEIDHLTDQFDYLEFDPDQIENRISTIKTIKKKYGSSYNEIL
jgi:DNA repair protein RecN (Recombination protein N)